MSRNSKRQLKKPYRVLRRLYVILVILAALIVVGYAVFKIAVPAPEISEAGQTDVRLDEGVAPNVDSGDHTRKEKTYTFLLACPDQESGNADGLMLVTYDVPNQKVGMLSIPRDTLVKRKDPKINAAFHGGVENLREVVSDLVGYPIDFYVTIDLDGFEEIVDAVGGVDFDVPVEMYYNDPTQDLNIFYMPGYQHLDGQSAMEVCRFRKNGDGTGYPMGDVQRGETVRNMMVTVAKKVVSWSSVSQIDDFMDIVARNIDTNMTMRNMAWFASQGMALNLTTGVAGGSLPGDGNVTYKGVTYCYELYPEESLQLINDLVNPYTTPLTLKDTNIFQAP